MAEYESLLEKVRALLAKAASTTFPAEADSFRAKADELMTKHAIEQWEIDRAQTRATHIAIRKDLDINWYWETRDRELASLLWSLCSTVMYHCRVETVIGKADYRAGKLPIVGMPSDVSYSDILFTHLMNQVIDQMDPRPKGGDTLESALARMKEAGMKWKDIYQRLVDAGLQEDWGPWTSGIASKCNYAGKYTRFCETTNRKRLRVSPAVHRRSFIYGFNDTMNQRFYTMRESQGQYSGSMALTIRDYRAKIKEAVWLHFPDLKPHPADCQCEKCVAERAAVAAAAKRKPRRAAKPKMVKVDHGSMREGSAAAENVELISREDSSRQRISGELN